MPTRLDLKADETETRQGTSLTPRSETSLCGLFSTTPQDLCQASGSDSEPLCIHRVAGP